MTKFTSYHPYTQVELVVLGEQFQQKTSEPLVTWLLRLCDLGVDSIMCMDKEMEKLSSLTKHPLLCQ